MNKSIQHAGHLAERIADIFAEESPDAQTCILALGIVSAAVASRTSKPGLMLGLIAQQVEKYRSHGNFDSKQVPDVHS